MNKTLKILIMFFSVVCLAVLVVFCVELFLQNRGVERGVIQAPAVTTDDSNDQPPDYNDNEEYQPQEEEPPEDIPPEPLLEWREIIMPSGEFVLGMYVDINSFEHDDTEEVVDSFIYLGEGATAFLGIHMVRIPEESDNYAIEFMENSFGVQGVPDEMYYYDERYRITFIGDSDLSGVYAIAIEEEVTYETWILAIPYTDNLGVAITIRWQNDTQRIGLEAILNTMELLPISDMNDNDPDADD